MKSEASPLVRILLGLLLLSFSLGLLGCGPAAAPPTPAATSTASSAPLSTAKEETEEWFVVRMGGSPCGWIRESRSAGKDGAVDFQMSMRIRLLRGKDEASLRQEVQWSETAHGELLRFASTFTAGPTPQRLDGLRRGANLILQTPSAAGTKETARPWPAGAESFSAVERRLEGEPLAAGKRFKVLKLDWLGPTAEFVEVEVQILDREPPLKEGDANKEKGRRPELVGLWRAEQRMKLPGGQPISTMTLWLDDRGRLQRALSPQLQQEIVRSTKESALAPEQPPPDVFALSLVPLEPAGVGDLLVRAPAAEYQAAVADWDAGKDGASLPFAETSFQTVSATSPGVWTVRVRRPSLPPHAAASPSAPAGPAKNPDAPPPPPKSVEGRGPANGIVPPLAAESNEKLGPANGSAPPATAESNEKVDWMHEAVQKLAKEVEKGESAAETARRLTAKVHGHMKLKNFTQALGSAGDAAATGEGDCTEHAFLLAALARAHGLPSRAAVGLVYVERPRPGFLYHMWTEIECDGVWLPFDGTTGGPVHAGYLQIASNDLSAADSAALFLPVQRLVGRLKLLLVSPK